MFGSAKVAPNLDLLVHTMLNRPQVGQMLRSHHLQKVCAPHAFEFDQATGFRMLLKVDHHFFAMRTVIVVWLTVRID